MKSPNHSTRKESNQLLRRNAFLEAVSNLKAVGWKGCVSCKNGRGRWWVGVRDVSVCKTYLKVGGGVGFGKERWVPVKEFSDASPPNGWRSLKSLPKEDPRPSIANPKS